MKFGILSDTHDDIQNTKKAIEVFNTLDVDCVFHAGDYIYPGMIALFGELKRNTKFYGVRGNNDGEIIGLVAQFGKLDNAFFLNEFGRIRIESKEVGIYHGTNLQLSEVLVESQIFDLLILGHTHKKRIEKIGKTLVLNPGPLNRGFFHPTSDDYASIIVYDQDNTDKDEGIKQDFAKFIRINRD
ncbi:metallophosphoesterase [Candidatus Nitrosocosmicus sp. FF01]|uniref:metallophosphoesterase n=1 Tax=Candidatus Nitrosocosmicus sp. FF01 TaxID=3397670 RepID=UPI0039E9328B